MKENLKNLLGYARYYLGIQKIPDILNNINIETTSRCNLKCKFCAYDKRNLDEVPYTTMPQEMFEDVVKQSLDLGYENIGLTPTTGDIFMDKKLFDKLIFLDNQSRLDGYYFYTNFIPLNQNIIDQIFNLKKIKNFGISIYGNDLETFKKLSGGNEIAYNKLLENLRYFKNKILTSSPKFKVEISQRTLKQFKLSEAYDEISKIIKELLSKNLIEFSQNSEFNNWGGLIKEKDIDGLGIKLHDPNKKKIGSCSLIYSRLIIGANGLVNACACRDANYTLAIGSVKNNKLKEIINLKNVKYRELIERQERNDFPDVCKSCDFYKSIYQSNDFIWSFRNKKIKHNSLKNVFRTLENR